jgi:hypothetical protein
VEAAAAPASEGRSEHGLKKDAIGFIDGLIIGIASTAPAYSLAAVLAIVVVAVGVQAPAVLLASFVPMFLIASSLLLGVVLMLLWRSGGHREFFGRRLETVSPEVAAGRKVGVAAVPEKAV